MNYAPEIRIDYQSEGFSSGYRVSNGDSTLVTSWDELLWAAITVGRPNRQYVFRHGLSSFYEALFRWSLVRMSLEQRGPTASRLHRTEAVKTLDPSEKGAVNYFLGMVMCKLFSAKLLDAPWMLHLDVFRSLLNTVLTSRSRPDLVGQTVSGGWVALESKGRISKPSTEVKSKAKQQAERLVSIDGVSPLFHIGAITYFHNDILRFYWQDPKPYPTKHQKTIEVSLGDNMWSYYYAPAISLIKSKPEILQKMLHEPSLMPIDGLDIQLGIYPKILERLVEGKWIDIKKHCIGLKNNLLQDNYQFDGIKVVAGSSWLKPFEESNLILHR